MQFIQVSTGNQTAFSTPYDQAAPDNPVRLTDTFIASLNLLFRYVSAITKLYAEQANLRHRVHTCISCRILPRSFFLQCRTGSDRVGEERRKYATHKALLDTCASRAATAGPAKRLLVNCIALWHMKWILCLLPVLLLLQCRPAADIAKVPNNAVSIVVLGTVQDGGSPHAGCKKDCCRALFAKPDAARQVVALGVIDAIHQQHFLLEASPDLPRQMKLLKTAAPFAAMETPDGILLTHAHIGHYSGLMYLGREAMNAGRVPVLVMPRMRQFLESNGPWSQLVALNNIALQTLEGGKAVQLTPSVLVTAFTVPHRDEFSETVGFLIKGPQKKALFIPDIDKWEKWATDIADAIAQVDYAFIDGTFYDAAEISNRNMAEIPHPFVVESMARLSHLPAAEKRKVHFIHFNHTNPLLHPGSRQARAVLDSGFNIARFKQVVVL